MQDIEQRLLSLESSHSTLNKIAAQQMLHNRETDEHLTILLGIVKGQEADIKTVLARLDGIEAHLSRLESRMDERFEAIMALLQARQ
jgi:hypothetical protein